MNYHVIKEQNFSNLKKEIQKVKSEGKMPLVIIENDDLIRKISESEKDIILATELKNRRDKLYQRDSGFDNIVLKFMSKNKIILGIILDEFLKSEKQEKAKILARIKQSIKLAKKKTKIKFIILNSSIAQKDEKNLFALALIIGADTTTAKIASQLIRKD